jgi:predicted phosphoribosyltransferase
MRFKDREEAAAQLAGRLRRFKGQRPLVLGVPRGAVPMARIIADALGGDCDVVLVRKVRAPGQPELAIGAVDETGAVVRSAYFDIASDEYIREELRAQQEILRKRRELYTRAQPAIDPAGRLVVIARQEASADRGGHCGGAARVARPRRRGGRRGRLPGDP